MLNNNARLLDLRELIGRKYRGEQPVLVTCPFHNDTDASLAVYPDHGHCYSPACTQGHFVRRYAMAAYLLGLWDGRQGTELEAVRELQGKWRAGVLIPPSSAVTMGSGGGVLRPETVSDDEVACMTMTFQRYLFSGSTIDTYTGVPILQTLKDWRGYSERTIRDFRLGWTGTHFSIPVFSVSGATRTIRYRAHPLLRGLPRYEGLAGRNEQQLFSLPHVERGATDARELWVVEGEFDHIATVQLGGWSVTVTNGAGSFDTLLDQFARLSLNVRRWILAMDQDEAGEEAAWKLSQHLPNAYRADWSVGKDMNEYMLAGGDLDSIHKKRIKQRTA